MTSVQAPAPSARAKKRHRSALNDGGKPRLYGVVVKIILLGIVDAAMLFAIMVLISNEDFLFAGAATVVTLLVNYIYLRPRGGLPAKYLTPGLIFLAIFQIYVVIYSGYIAFTNYGTMNNSDKPDAINALLLNGQTRVAEAEVYPLNVLLDAENRLNLLVTVPQDAGDPKVFVGANGEVASEVGDASFNSLGVADGVPGFTTLTFREVADRQQDLVEIRLYLSDDPESYFWMTADASQAVTFMPRLDFDPLTDTMTRVEDGKVFSDTGVGAYISSDGEKLAPGWRIEVGFDNFVRAIANDGIREPLLRVTLWTFIFALVSVGSTFALGLGLALLFNEARLRGQRWYRVAMVLPYAFPGFLSAFVWRAMLQDNEYGLFNRILMDTFGMVDPITFLNDPLMGKISILMVNLWLGFPYMFLITTGALQSIPNDLMESARIDGASPWQQLRLIKLPLLLVSVAPLLITSFAFNFNNFSLIYLLTGGGPKDFDADINVGHTDILISMVYKIAFSTGEGRDFGLASAFSILIFFIVGTISYLSFRRTRTLEDVN